MTGRRILVATALVAAAGVLATLGVVLPEQSARAHRSRAALVTPLWSLRRYPLPVTSAVVDDVEQQRVTDALTGYVARFDRSCFVVRRGDAIIAAGNPDVPLLPASTQKLLTATAALDILGPDFRYTTTAVANREPTDGSVEQLWVIGAGDPSLSTAQYADVGVSTPLEGLADAIVASGVRRIAAGIAVDDFRYDDERAVRTWRASYITQFESGLLGALTANHGIPLVNGRPVTAADPGLYAASELTRLLRARGVAIGADPTRSAAPAGAVAVGSVTSLPLRSLIAFMLKISDNFAAELLTKELGLQTSGSGSTAAGTAATMADMQRLGMPTAGVVMNDGSGLDRGDRMTCRALAAVAARAREPGPRSLAGLLPAAGDGTSVHGRVQAKGGYLDDVIGLAGLLDGGRGFDFAFLANGRLSPQPGADLIGFAETLARVPTFDASAVVPPPDPPIRG